MYVETPEGNKPISEAVKITNARLGAGTSKDAKKVLIDKNIPKKIGKINVIKSIAHHESLERRLMDAGLKYPQAHDIAEKYENRRLHTEQGASKHDVMSYEHKIKKFLKEARKDKSDKDLDPRVS